MAAIENVALWHERDISHSSVERVIVPDSCITLNYMFSLMNKLIDNLLIYPENALENLNKTRGLVFSQKILLKLVEKGATREDAYKMVQTPAMKVWQDNSTNLECELLKSDEVRKYLSDFEIKESFNTKEMVKNVDYIFARSVELN
jgi:adenylosuccinate lyase